jgi:DNA (cytosine-5)-methyltransferase 1
VLEEIAETEIPMPKDNKWAPAGEVEWDGGSLAWRVLDAQYWGVPQRRKRIFLVADFAGQSAGEILFEPEGVPGDSAESEGEREGIAADAGASTESPIWDVRISSSGTQNWRAHCYEATRCRALDTGGQDPDSNHGGLAIYDMTHADEVMRPAYGDKSNCLNSRMGTGGNQVPVVHCLNDQGGSVMDVSDKAGTLRAQSHGHEPIVHTICGNIIGRENQNGGHQMGVGKDVSFTLNTVDRHAVCAIGIDQQGGKGQANYAIEKCPTLAAESHGTPHAVAVGYRASGFQSYSEDKVAGTLRAEGGTAGGGQRNLCNQRKVGCLNARDYKGVGSQYVDEGKLVIDD